MPTETIWRDSARKKALAVLVGHNLPFVLWTFAAALKAWGGGRLVLWPCPVRTVLGWCPGCGLTGDYASLLRMEGFQSWRLVLVLSILTANAVWSLVKARKVLRGTRPADPTPS